VTKEIAVQPQPADQTFSLLQQAVQAGTSPEALEKLLDLQERVLARNALGEYTAALAQFQSRCPAIQKRKTVADRGGRVMYKFAPLEDIVAQIRDLLAELGLSFSFDSDADDQGGVTVTCTIRHRAGHAEPCRVRVPATTGHNTNASQNMGIQLKYGQRYALIGALGITTADEDTDGATQEAGDRITADQAVSLETLAQAVGADSAKFLAYMRAGSFDQIAARDYGRAVAALEAKRAHK
jgi:hypothetical protein